MAPQNFSIPAGYNDLVTFEIGSPLPASPLDGVTVWWRVYLLQFGVPNFGYLSLGSPSPDPIIEKTSLTSPADVVLIDSPLSITVQMHTTDTIGLLRNYYHEATFISADMEVIGGLFGIMTVTATSNRQSGVTS